MRTDQRSLSLPGFADRGRAGLVRIRRGFSAAPVIVKILMVAGRGHFLPRAVGGDPGSGRAPFTRHSRSRPRTASVVASLSVAVWGLAVVSALSGGYKPWLALLLLLPFAVVAAAHAGLAGPAGSCRGRTVAWTLAWAVPVGDHRLAASREPADDRPGGRLADRVRGGWDGGWPSRCRRNGSSGRQAGAWRRSGRAPTAWPSSQAPREGWAGWVQGAAGRDEPGRARLARARAPGPAAGPGPAGRRPRGNGRIAAAAEAVPRPARRGGPAGRPPDAAHGPAPQPVRRRSRWTRPMAELDNMIGLTAVKDQVRSIAASIEGRAQGAAVAGYATDKPMQHLVFLGPPGTGKTAVAPHRRQDLLRVRPARDGPAVVEAHRADLVGEYLGCHRDQDPTS